MDEILHHDIYDFFEEASTRIQGRYAQIRRAAKTDPGTAGDEGEENWAKLLRDWLPRSYSVATKGQILGPDGSLSRQVDVVVLKPSYPQGLIQEGRKRYLAAGVAAAFECKATLRSRDIDVLFEQARTVSNLSIGRSGTPFKELYPSIPYGLLAHSHSWNRKGERLVEDIRVRLFDAAIKYAYTPTHVPEFLCIATLGSWFVRKDAYQEPPPFGWCGKNARVGNEPAALVGYVSPSDTQKNPEASNPWEAKPRGYLTPVGGFLLQLWKRLAWEDPSLRDIALEMKIIPALGGRDFGKSYLAAWPTNCYSKEVREHLRDNRGNVGGVYGWDEWSSTFE